MNPPDRIALLAGLALAVIVGFARVIDQAAFWLHGLAMIGVSAVVWLNLRQEHSGFSGFAPLYALLIGSATVLALAQGVGIVPILRDATPILCMLAGILLTTLRLRDSLAIFKVHLVVAGLLMAATTIVQYLATDTSSPLAVYHYRASLPLYMSMVPLAALILISEASLLARATGVVLIGATFLSFGRIETGVLAAMAVLLVLSLRRRYAVPLVGLGVAAIAIGSTLFLSSDAGAGLGRITVQANDPSLGWRFIELQGFIDWFDRADAAVLLFGQGLGSEIRLPGLILDFNDRPSIPILHVSYLTWILKFGFFGLAMLLVSMIYVIGNATARGILGTRLVMLTMVCLFARGLVQHGLFEPYGLFMLGMLFGYTRAPLLALAARFDVPALR